MPANPLIDHFINGWRNTRTLCIQQLELIETGKIRFGTNGVDTTEETVATLRKVKGEMEALIDKHLE